MIEPDAQAFSFSFILSLSLGAFLYGFSACSRFSALVSMAR